MMPANRRPPPPAQSLDSQRPAAPRNTPNWAQSEESDRYIRCKAQECRQILGEWSENGRRVTVFTQYIEIDERGRLDLDCPVCRRRRRLSRQQGN